MGNTSKTGTAPELDGRLRRSERSREAIVQALISLVGEGVLQPTAEQVAEQAGVGIRTVFRHFSDMETLNAALNAHIEEELLPILLADAPEGSLEGRARALIDQRATLFEKMGPYRRAGNLVRWRSPFLQKQHITLVRQLRSDLRRWLPELRGAPDDLVEALDLAASFEAWDRLRTEQRLSRMRAVEVMRRVVVALVREL